MYIHNTHYTYIFICIFIIVVFCLFLNLERNSNKRTMIVEYETQRHNKARLMSFEPWCAPLYDHSHTYTFVRIHTQRTVVVTRKHA